MDKFTKLSAIGTLVVTVATVVGVFLAANGGAGATIWSVGIASALIAAGALYFVPSFVCYLIWRRQAARAGIVTIHDWVQPTRKEQRRAAVRESLLYVTVMDACDSLAIRGHDAADVVFPMLHGFNLKELTGQHLHSTVEALAKTVRYPEWKSIEEGRELAGRLVSQMETVGVSATVAYMAAFELEAALDAMESGLSLEYARTFLEKRRIPPTTAYDIF